MIVALCIAVAILLGVLFKKYRDGARLVEGAPRVSLLKVRNDLEGFHSDISECVSRHKAKLVVLNLPYMPIVLVTHPDVAKALLKDEESFPKIGFDVKSMFGSLLGKSILFASGDEWRHLRTTMAPAFHYDYLVEMVPMMVSKAKEVLAKMPNGELFSVKQFMLHLTVDILGLASFGIDFNTIGGDNSNEYYTAYEQLVAHARKYLSSPIPAWLIEMIPLPSHRKARAAREKLLCMTRKIIKNRENMKEKKYLIDMMCEANPSLSADQLEVNIFLFFIAGHETTAAALTWALYLLARHQDIQARVREEVDIVLNGENVDSGKLKKLIYMDMFVKEVLRYGSPVAAVFSRKTSKDLLLDGQFIPKNTQVGLGIRAIHYNPDFWPNPDIFNPDRFALDLEGPTSTRHPFAFLPFTLGRRVCIGNTFSLIEQKVFLCMLLQNYTVTTTEEVLSSPFKFDPSSLANVPNDVNIVLCKR